MIHILFISRATLFNTKGGDTVQVENTARALEQLGLKVSIERCDNKNIQYNQYHLLHFFNIIRPADILYHIQKSNLPYVVSPIYLEYEDNRYYNRSSLKGLLFALLNKNGREYFKCIARALKNGERITSKQYLLLGHKRSIIRVLKSCSHLLPNSQSEYNRLKKDFPCAGSYSIIPNAVDTAVFKFNEKVSRCDDKVLCVARFEPKKNQLNLIKALSNTPYQLTLAGNIAPNHTAYYKRCKKEAGPNVTFLDSPPQEKIVSLYQSHKVHVLASWFETTGLSTLEAAACGSNIVITNKGDTVEYFGTNACYCDPDSPESIKAAIDQAAEQPVNKVFMERIKRNYNWMLTAHKTLAAYQQFLDR